LRHQLGKGNLFASTPIFAAILLIAGCVYNLNLEKSSPLPGNPKDHQPIAVLPIQDASGYPQSGANLHSSARAVLAAKGYTLINAAEVSQALEELGLSPPALLSDQASLTKANERLRAKLLMVGTILEYRVQKSYMRPQAFQVWEGASYEYRTLPTYHQGTCQIGLKLRLVEPEKSSVVWIAEGRIRGPSTAAEVLGRRLVERLLENIPPLSPKQ
jgi:hypothetical protein